MNLKTKKNKSIAIPKIRGYIATKKNKILFLYRKSNKITYLISLNYQKEKESIQIGSRFYGSFYPNRCDISPDGTYFLYFVMGKSQKKYDKKLYCWTAICKPPQIKAELLFAHGDIWGGGGKFINDETIFISPSMYPQFKTNNNYQLDKYKITFEKKYEDDGWASGKNWKLSKTQIAPYLPENSKPIPKYWTKENGKSTLIRYLIYTLIDKSNVGLFDIHRYEIKDKNGMKYSLNFEDKICLWADFDNYGRLVVARKSEIFIYKNLKNLIDNKPFRTFDFEKLIQNKNNS